MIPSIFPARGALGKIRKKAKYQKQDYSRKGAKAICVSAVTNPNLANLFMQDSRSIRPSIDLGHWWHRSIARILQLLIVFQSRYQKLESASERV